MAPTTRRGKRRIIIIVIIILSLLRLLLLLLFDKGQDAGGESADAWTGPQKRQLFKFVIGIVGNKIQFAS